MAAGPAGAQAAEDRLAALSAEVDRCIADEAPACLARTVPGYLEAARAAPAADGAPAALRRQQATYYFDAARLALADPAVTAQILSGPGWSSEIAYDRSLYLRRRLLEARIRLALGQEDGAVLALDKLLSLVAALQNPEADKATVAGVVASAIGLLAQAGEGERAFGLYRATRATLPGLLPPRSLVMARYRLAEASLLAARGDAGAARTAAEAALELAASLDLEPATRQPLLAEALTLQAAACAAAGDLGCATIALDRHPPAVESSGKPAAAFRAVKAAVAAQAGGPGSDLLTAARGLGPPERWGALGPLLTSVLLGQGQAALGDPELVFSLFQQASRTASTFDAEAVASIGGGADEAERRARHQALRLRARRDRIEREQVQAVLARAAGPAATDQPLTHDVARRRQLRDFAAALTDRDSARSGTEPVTLARLQAVLSPHEAALTVARTPRGLAYMCVRRGSVSWRTADADLARARLDGRLVQQALTAGHAPDERADSQFPVEAAIRLHQVYLQPFDGCLQPDDAIVWLPGVAGIPAPLAVLLREPPPKRPDGGYDLARADWLVRRHAVSYAGSPAVLVASRTAKPVGGDFDFLGVGDPVLPGAPAADRGGLRNGGVRIDGLSPLPETRAELKVTAAGFRTPRLLLGEEATERRVRGQVLGAYDYLSFATHGLIREDLQGLAEPALVLTPVNIEDPLDDGLLTASEIADLNLRARFVALSACNTANFDLDQLAQDLPALSSAFAVAGVPAALATLWPVDSQTGQQVVAATFARLRETGEGPARALALAQRAFLAAPPGRAWLHPRFWAPFVVLGEGGALPKPGTTAEPRLVSAEVLTRRGGEVLGLRRTAPGQVAARLISEADDSGRRGAALRLAADGRERWRRDRRDLGASRPLLWLGGRLIAAGYRAGANGRYAPVLETVTPAGAPAGEWQAQTAADRDGFPLAAAATGGDGAVVVVGELNLRGPDRPRGARLTLYSFGATGPARHVAEIDPPRPIGIDEATVTPLGLDLLVTYSTRSEPPHAAAGGVLDDWDEPLCDGALATFLELRDGRSGALKASRELPGLAVVAATSDGRRVLLGGSTRGGCEAEARASVVAVGPDLGPVAVWSDVTPGASEVRALSPLAGGRTLVAAHKRSVVDFAPPPAPGVRLDPYRLRRTDVTFAGLVLTLGRDGRPGATRILESGANVLLTAAETSAPAEILLGGALGGEAAIFHLTPAR